MFKKVKLDYCIIFKTRTGTGSTSHLINPKPLACRHRLIVEKSSSLSLAMLDRDAFASATVLVHCFVFPADGEPVPKNVRPHLLAPFFQSLASLDAFFSVAQTYSPQWKRVEFDCRSQNFVCPLCNSHRDDFVASNLDPCSTKCRPCPTWIFSNHFSKSRTTCFSPWFFPCRPRSHWNSIPPWHWATIVNL